MISKVLDHPEIYRIEVTLPDNPLKYLNSYVLPHPDRPLIIDTGFNRPECYEALMSGLSELNIDISCSDVFVTHVHGDHSGLAYKLHKMGATIYMNPVDHNHLKENIESPAWGIMEDWYAREGFPDTIIQEQQRKNHAKLYRAEALFPIKPVNDGDILSFAGETFEAVCTPGHTKGHICLYIPSKKIMFLGDHVLFDITPNITVWSDMDDALGSYLDSLEKIAQYDVALSLPAHRKNDISMRKRIEEIKVHHRNRLNSLEEIVRREPGLTAYEIAMRLPWSMRGKEWDEFPAGQKWFAMGETLSHVDYLIARDRLISSDENKRKLYYIPQA